MKTLSQKFTRQTRWALLKASIVALLASGFLSGCSTKALEWSGGASAISGSVLPLSTASSVSLSSGMARATAASSVCTNSTAHLYQVGSDGRRIEPAAATSAVDSQGNYRFEGVRSLGIKVVNRRLSGAYLVDIVSCGSVFTRFLTGTKEQDIGWGSTLVSYSLNTGAATQVLSASPQKLESLYGELKSHDSFTAAYAALVTSTPIRMSFEDTVGVAPEVLEDAAPNAVSVNVPTRIREGETAAISLSAKQWDTNYPYAYEWKIDGQLISTAANPAFVPSGNSQGPHTLAVTWGKQASGGSLDTSKPQQTKTFPILIENNVLPQPPLLSVASASVNTPAVTLSINTGASLANCATFSALAVTEDIATAPVTPGSYTYSCSQAGSQNLLYTLQNGVGPHTLYLWAMDAAGEISLVPRSVAVNYSLIVPNVAITSPAPGTAYPGAVTIAGTCEDDAGDVTLNGPIVSAPVLTSCSGGSYARSVTLGGADGAKTVVASQINQFGNTGSASLNLVKDSTAPTVSFSSLSPGTTNAPSFVVTATFSESVSGFDLSKVQVANGSASAFTGTGSSYSFTITPAAQGTVTVDIPAGSGTDSAGNSSVASATFSRVFDSQAPSVSIASSAPNPTRLNAIPVSLTFSEPVTGLGLPGLQVTNGTASALTGSGSTYSFQVAPSGQGSVSVSVAAGAAQDLAGNGSTASATLARIFDSVAPSLTLTSVAPNPTNTAPIPVQAAFGESVTGFSLAGLTVTNGTAGNLTGAGAAYAFEITPSGNGTVSVAVDAGAAKDAAGNDSVAANLSRTFNNSRPSVNLTSVRPSPTNLAPFPVTVTFSAAVTGFDASKVTISNAAVGSFSGSGASYSFQATPSGNGTVTMSVAANSAVDSAANQNLASNSLSIVYDTAAPVVSILNPTNGAYVNASSQAALGISGACSEEGLPVSVSISSVTAAPVCASGAWSATLNVSALADGALSITAGQTDLAGNTGSATAINVSKDTAAPTVTLAGSPTGASNALALAVTAGGSGVSAYQYKVGVASATDCSVATGYSAEVGTGTAITDSLTGLADGAVRLCAIGRDLAGNFQSLASATSVSWTKDTAVTPFGTLSINPASPGKVTTPAVSGTAEANASVQLFAQAACAGPAKASGTANGAGAFSLSSSSLGGDGAYTLSVRASDAAGNTLCSSGIAYSLDTLSPSVTISSASPSNTNSSPIAVSLTFSEPVTGLASSGISVTNGSVAGLSGSGSAYSFNVVPSGQGTVTVAVNANAASDAAGNGTLASLTLTRVYDTVAPALTIAGPAAGSGFNTGTITLNGACETGLTIGLSGSGHASPATTTCAAGTYSVAIIPTAGDGTKNITLTQTDAAGNVATQTRAFEKDTVAPALLFTSVAVQNQNSNTNSVTFTGSCETGVAVNVSGTDTNSVACTGSSWSYVTAPKASDATRGYTFTQTDSAGNATAISGSWTRDTVLPVVAITSPAAGFVAYESVTVAGTCETGLPVTLSGVGLLSDINNVPCTAGAFSRFAYLSNGDGSKAVTASQADLANNVGSSSRSFVRDTTPPALTQTLRASPYSNNTNTAQFGGACENGLSISVTGTETGSATCASGSWTYTTGSQATDASRAYAFKQVDAAGNQTQISATWVRDTVAPVLAFTSASSFTTSGNTVSFAGTCEAGLSIAVSGAQTATVPCSSGTWTFATSQTTDNVYNYTFSETDQAGNVSSVAGTWTRSTSGPTLAITQSTPQVTNGSSLVISGTCSGGTAGSTGTISVTGAVTTTVACSSTNATVGSWSYTANQGSDGTYNYTFGLTDNFASPRSTSASLSWMRDATAPVLTNGSFTINGGQSTTAVSYNPVSFAATDNLSAVNKFCLKGSSSAPPAQDPCWYGVSSASVSPGNSILVSSFPFNIGIVPQAYSIFLWVMDGAGNVSTNSATLARDQVSISLSPIAPPIASSVIVSGTDVMNGAISERSIPAGEDLFIRWLASGSNLPANPISISFTTDDSNYTVIAAGLANGQNNCTSTQGPGTASTSATGCYKWSNGSPSNAYYRIRVGATNDLGSTSYANSLPVNASNLQILAGSTEPGINGSAKSAVFQSGASPTNSSAPDSQSLVVSTKGIIYFRDATNGLMSIDPVDGKLRQLIPLGAASSGVGDGGPISTARLRLPSQIELDYKDRLLIFDYDRIRRVDFTQNPPTISTIIGGGASVADDVSNPLSMALSAFNSFGAGWGPYGMMRALPNGDIYFFSNGSYSFNQYKRIRIYREATNSVTALYPTSSTTLNFGSYTIASVANCGVAHADFRFDPSSGIISRMYIQGLSSLGSSCTSVAATAGTDHRYEINPSTGAALTVIPAQYAGFQASTYAAPVSAHDGRIYRIDRSAGQVKFYDTDANTWTVIAGSGVVGTCADNTTATSCNMSLTTAYVTTAGELYVMDGGRIRTVVAGKVVTIAGQEMSFGDGGAATNARFGSVAAAQQKSDGAVVVFDFGASRFRIFSRNSTIDSIAGNGVISANPNTTSAANTQPLRPSGRSFIIDGNDRIKYSIPYRIWDITASVGSMWNAITGQPTQVFSHLPAADGAQFANIQMASDSVVMGYTPGKLLYGSGAYTNNTQSHGTFSEVDLATGINSTLAGGIATGTGYICPVGTVLTSCYLNTAAHSWLPSSANASYDTVNNLWLVIDSDSRTIKAFSKTSGTMLQETVLNNPATAINFQKFGSTRYMYYCNGSNSRIYLRNIDNGTEVALPWPVSTIGCTGRTLVYDPSNHSLIFPYKQNGLTGVAELLNVDPSNNGI